MTPREIAGAMAIEARLRKRETASDLAVAFNAARGDPRKVREMIAKMGKD